MIINGDCLEELNKLDENSIDAVVTDPPYELNFMGKGWDNAGVSFNKGTWQKCLRVLKPGGYLLAFGGTRTYHRIACAIEDAGFEIRDCIMWLYGSGFPKSMNIGLAIDKKNGVESKVIGKGICDKTAMLGGLRDEITTNGNYEIKEAQNEWKGWGTALKPSYEPIIVARKPFKGSLVDNVIEHGVGGLNIDECRVGNEHFEIKNGDYDEFTNNAFGHIKRTPKEYNGRFPANTILTYGETDCDTTSWLRYFYCAKASKKDRDEGLDEFEDGNITDGRKAIIDNPYLRKETPRKNVHPTVKPTSLMQYLIRLVSPKGATILDPFMGSGSTGKAVIYENKERNAGYNFIGIEQEPEYCKIAEARIKFALGDK